MTRTLIEGCAIATMDAAGTEHADGHLVIEDDRLVAVGAGPAPEELARGCPRSGSVSGASPNGSCDGAHEPDSAVSAAAPWG